MNASLGYQSFTNQRVWKDCGFDTCKPGSLNCHKADKTIHYGWKSPAHKKKNFGQKMTYAKTCPNQISLWEHLLSLTSFSQPLSSTVISSNQIRFPNWRHFSKLCIYIIEDIFQHNSSCTLSSRWGLFARFVFLERRNL